MVQLIYTPQMVLFVLTAVQASKNADNFKIAAGLNVLSWIMQFIGHGVAEKRAPALLDNLLGGTQYQSRFHTLRLIVCILHGYSPRSCSLLRSSRVALQGRIQASTTSGPEERYWKGDYGSQEGARREEASAGGEGAVRCCCLSPR